MIIKAVLVGIIALASAVGIYFFMRSSQPTSSLKQECPDEWYDDHMPYVANGEETSRSKEYFVINGARVETTEYDIAWIRENCSVEPAKVY